MAKLELLENHGWHEPLLDLTKQPTRIPRNRSTPTLFYAVRSRVHVARAREDLCFDGKLCLNVKPKRRQHTKYTHKKQHGHTPQAFYIEDTLRREVRRTQLQS